MLRREILREGVKIREKESKSTWSMMAEFEKITQSLEQWSSGKAVILSGHGGYSCTGVDLDLVKTILNGEGGQRMMAHMYIPSPCITFQDQDNAFCWYLLDGLPCRCS